MDLMRLPLGILTGVGFIGAGVILRRGEMVAGVTTAATMWMVTVIGLCFGGGQVGLGWAATAIALATLWGLGWLESRIQVERKVKLVVEVEETGPSEDEVRSAAAKAGLRVIGHSVSADRERRCRRFEIDMLDLRTPLDIRIPAFAQELSTRPGVVKWHWESVS
jgi:putative Mg2+ transporter-C (MgtC) family protein